MSLRGGTAKLKMPLGTIPDYNGRGCFAKNARSDIPEWLQNYIIFAAKSAENKKLCALNILCGKF